ncbi:type I pantothenate kinase [Gleimia sp. 6138-11-ORH1]|uniref:type I pantothenate kinase n=1 Tax=Gleimia sp. 6138-11-ORH1 TaxID=2973937 RepID=UPI002167F1BB|nr:type I pantothenate kinase [Gleimia sp. 6138-11-ORH1]MCS4484578.1 type I pantothenate kinase [Gleimia sp. 6138-11-ORH1]
MTYYSATESSTPKPGIFEHFSRQTWRRLAADAPLPLTSADITTLTSLGDRLDIREADIIYRPLSALLEMHVAANRKLALERQAFLKQSAAIRTPFIIGIGGSVAVGKSTIARLLLELLRRWPNTPHVQLVTTDGFLYPNAVLEERGLMTRKGFPESYNRAQLLRFLAAVKAGEPVVTAPMYSHVTYDVTSDVAVITNPDILIVEGLNVLQPARSGPGALGTVAVSDYFDFSIYVDADATDIQEWYIERFKSLRETTFSRADSYFHTYASLSDAEATSKARQIWKTINLVNLEENILPTRDRASLIIRKGCDHQVEGLYLRRL